MVQPLKIIRIFSVSAISLVMGCSTITDNPIRSVLKSIRGSENTATPPPIEIKNDIMPNFRRIGSALFEARVNSAEAVAQELAHLPFYVEESGKVSWRVKLTYDLRRCETNPGVTWSENEGLEYARTVGYFGLQRIKVGQGGILCLPNYFSALAEMVASAAIIYEALEVRHKDTPGFLQEVCKSKFLGKNAQRHCAKIKAGDLMQMVWEPILEPPIGLSVLHARYREWALGLEKKISNFSEMKDYHLSKLAVFQTCYTDKINFPAKLKEEDPKGNWSFIEYWPKGFRRALLAIKKKDISVEAIIEMHCRGSECALYGEALRNGLSVESRNIKLAICNKAGGLVGKKYDLHYTDSNCPGEQPTILYSSNLMYFPGTELSFRKEKDISSCKINENSKMVKKAVERLNQYVQYGLGLGHVFNLHIGKNATVTSTIIQNSSLYKTLKADEFVAIEMESAHWVGSLKPSSYALFQWFSDVPTSGDLLTASHTNDMKLNQKIFDKMNDIIMTQLVLWLL